MSIYIAIGLYIEPVNIRYNIQKEKFYISYNKTSIYISASIMFCYQTIYLNIPPNYLSRYLLLISKNYTNARQSLTRKGEEISIFPLHAFPCLPPD